MREIKDQTPKEIDAQLAELLAKQYGVQDKLEMVDKQLRRLEAQSYGRADEQWKTELLATKSRLNAELDKLVLEVAPLEDEFQARGGWTRGFLALTNGGKGHVHSSRSCSTCNNGRYMTRFHWLTQVSGDDEATIVDTAGDGACTVCYPTAPVAIDPNYVKPNGFKTPEQIALEADRRAKAEAKAEKERLTGIKDVDGSELLSKGPHDRGRVVKTARAATNQIAGDAGDIAWYAGHPYEPQWIANVVHLAKAVAHRNGLDLDTYLEEIAAKAAKKAKDNMRSLTAAQTLARIRSGL